MDYRRFPTAAAAAGISILTAALWAAAADCAAPPSSTGRTSPPPVKAKPAGSDQQADNSLCYVCHLSLQKEELTAAHQVEGIGCIDCHGTSSEHMHDEMLMTKADRLFGRREVGAMCAECHDEPHEDKPQEVKAFLEKWRGRDRPNGRVITDESICTDCHGIHVVAKKADAGHGGADDWLPAFNGRDLAGWQTSPGDAWKVDRGRIVAVPRAGVASADLWSDALHGDFRVSVTFRWQGRMQAGIWLRGQPSTPGPRVEIFASRPTSAGAGSVFVPGRGLALVNLRDDLLEDDAWNTINAEVRGPRIAVSVNGEEIGSVAVAGPAQGRIGLHVEGLPEAKDAQLTVREILVQKYSEEESSPKDAQPDPQKPSHQVTP